MHSLSLSVILELEHLLTFPHLKSSPTLKTARNSTTLFHSSGYLKRAGMIHPKCRVTITLALVVFDESVMTKIKNEQNIKKSQWRRIIRLWFWLAFKKYILSSVLKALALKAVIGGWLSQSSYIQGLEETMQHIYADQSVHCWSENASLIFSVPFPLSATFASSACSLP